jgi:hypothetical protein
VGVKSNLWGLFVSGLVKLKHCKLDCQTARNKAPAVGGEGLGEGEGRLEP